MLNPPLRGQTFGLYTIHHCHCLQVIDAASSEEHAQAKLNREIIILGIIYFVGAIASFVRSWLFTVRATALPVDSTHLIIVLQWAGQRLVARIRRDVFAAIVSQDISFFDTNRTGELTNRLASDTSVIQNGGYTCASD